MVGGEVDRGGPRLAQPDLRGRRQQSCHPLVHPRVVGAVELGRLAGLLLGVAHPPHHAALAGPPVDPRRHVEDHRQPLGREVRVALGDHHLVARAAGRDPDARCGAHGRQARPSGQHHATGRDVAGRGTDAGHRAALDDQPGERRPLADAHSGGEERRGVGQDVARRLEVAVTGGVRRPERLPGRHRRVHRVGLVTVDPAHLETNRLLHRDPRVCLLDLRLGEARHEVALLHEPGVDAEQVVLPEVELAAEEPEPDRGLGAALRAHHACRTRARALAQGVPLQQHHVTDSGAPQEPRGPRPDRPSADDDRIGTARHSGHDREGGID